MNKKLEIFHNIVEVAVLAIIACAAFTIMIVDFRVLGGLRATVMTIAQIIVCLTCIPGGYMLKRGIDAFFEWIEDIMIEEREA